MTTVPKQGEKSGSTQASVVPAPRRVAFDAPWAWLGAGWRDMWLVPGFSLTYGGLFALAAAALWILSWAFEGSSLFPVLAGAFLLIGPFAAVGFYEASRKLASGEKPAVSELVWSGVSAAGQIAFFGVFLMVAMAIWFEAALLLMMLFLGTGAPPQANEFVQAILFSDHGLALLIVGSLVGGILATLVYSLSVVAMPMLLDRHVDVVTAARASFNAVVHNPRPMALWAVLIVVMVGAGFATLLFGLVVAIPLIGHTTWHAYQDIYGSPPKSDQQDVRRLEG